MKYDIKTKKFRIVALLVIALLIAFVGHRFYSKSSIFQGKNFIIAHDSSWYPLDFRGKDQIMTAFTQEIIRMIDEDTGFSIRFTDIGTSNLFYGLDYEYYDGVITSLVPNAINKREYYFSDSFYPLGPVLVVRSNSEITGMKDLQGKIVGVEANINQLYHVDDDSSYITISYKNIPAALENLERDIIDAVLMDSLSAYTYTQAYYAGRLKVATAPLIDGGLRVATLITPRNAQFISEFNEGLKKIKEDGTYDKILKKWELTKPTL